MITVITLVFIIIFGLIVTNFTCDGKWRVGLPLLALIGATLCGLVSFWYPVGIALIGLSCIGIYLKFFRKHKRKYSQVEETYLWCFKARIKELELFWEEIESGGCTKEEVKPVLDEIDQMFNLLQAKTNKEDKTKCFICDNTVNPDHEKYFGHLLCDKCEAEVKEAAFEFARHKPIEHEFVYYPNPIKQSIKQQRTKRPNVKIAINL